MRGEDELGSLPEVSIEMVEDRTEGLRPDRGFLRIRRLRLQNRREDGSASEVYPYDMVERDALDAVVILLFDAEARVCLRSALRPPLAFRGEANVPLEVEQPSAWLWELPAGLVESDERGEAGLAACASRETLEEVGLEVDPARFFRLGPPIYLSPGVMAEQVHFWAAEVDPARRGVPLEDGSPVEEGAAIHFIALESALAACEAGQVADAKTEVALSRLARRMEGLTAERRR